MRRRMTLMGTLALVATFGSMMTAPAARALDLKGLQIVNGLVKVPLLNGHHGCGPTGCVGVFAGLAYDIKVLDGDAVSVCLRAKAVVDDLNTLVPLDVLALVNASTGSHDAQCLTLHPFSHGDLCEGAVDASVHVATSTGARALADVSVTCDPICVGLAVTVPGTVTEATELCLQ